MKASYKKALEKAAEIDKDLRSDTGDFNDCVQVRSILGCECLFYSDAFAMEYSNAWYLVFTEHHGFHVFDMEDYAVRQFTGTVFRKLK